MKICKDGRIYGQNNKEAGDHLGILTGRKRYIKTGRKRRRGKHPIGYNGGRENPMYGKHHSVETKRKLREANWKGGIPRKDGKIRQSIQARLWCKAVFARDNWTCQKCGKQKKGITAHHIKSFTEYPELRFAIDNGETLCFECHKLTNNYGGGNRKL